jgi:uncharacterized protein
MDFLRRHLLDLAGAPFAIWLQWVLARRLSKLVAPRWRKTVQMAGVGAAILVFFSFAMGLPGVGDRLRYSPVLEWIKAAGLSLAVCAIGAWSIDLVGRRLALLAGPHNPGRRQALLAGRAAAMSIPAVMLGYGAFIERRHFRLVETRIAVPGLHKDLEGLRIVQLTDLHFGAFLNAADLRHAIGLANDTRAQIALVTGDLISVYSDPLDECMNLLRGLKSEAGTLGCLGNHEIVAGCEAYATRRGAETGIIQFLRNQARQLRFGEAELNIAGVDYQPKNKPYLTQTAPLLRKDSGLNLLLSHNPDVFPKAAAQGWDLTVAGHTHGGQITVEILGLSANPARFYTPYIYGNYKKDGRQINVSRGLGTVGIPSRIGAPPEVSLLTLCAT